MTNAVTTKGSVAVEFDGVVKAFGPVQVLHGVSLRSRRGACTACWARTARASPR